MVQWAQWALLVISFTEPVFNYGVDCSPIIRAIPSLCEGHRAVMIPVKPYDMVMILYQI